MEDMFYEAAHLGGFAARFAYASQVGYYTRINVVYALKQIDHSMYIIGGEAMEGMDDTIAGYTHFNPAIEAVRMEAQRECRIWRSRLKLQIYVNCIWNADAKRTVRIEERKRVVGS